MIEISVPENMTLPDKSQLPKISDREYFIHSIDSSSPFVSNGFQGRGLGDDLIIAISAGIPDPEADKNRGIVQGSIVISRLEDFSNSLKNFFEKKNFPFYYPKHTCRTCCENKGRLSL